MLTVMLCGAADIEGVREQFVEVARLIGADPWHFTSGHILSENQPGGSFKANSRRSVQQADVCVFTVMRDYGDLTWTTEFQEAIDIGKPFLVLCLNSTFNEYLAYRQPGGQSSSATITTDPRLMERLRELESQRSVTIVTFDQETFGEVCRRELAKVFATGVRALQSRYAREALGRRLSDTSELGPHDLAALEEAAVDEFEDKTFRKQALHVLARHNGVSADSVSALVGSREQGVQRLTISMLQLLYRERPVDPDVVSEWVSVANDSDDVGVARRLIPAVFDIDPWVAIDVLTDLDTTEVGTRRRLAKELEKREPILVNANPEQRAAIVRLLKRCVEESSDSGWLARAKALMARMSEDSETEDVG